jgi:hypothetical protein
MKTMHRTLAAGFAATLLGLAGCNSTQLETAWAAPQAGSIHFTKILVIAVAPDGATRRQAEDAMRAQITAVPVVASYELLPSLNDEKDRAKVARAIEGSGVDGIVVMRTVSNEKEVDYIPGTPMPGPYRSFYGYYTRPYAMGPMYYDSGTVVTNRIVGIETNIYNAKDEALIWSGLTKTTNPDQVDKLVAEVAGVVRAKLREQKLIP